jgi:methyltransferase (TIGR00027 family)
MDENSASRSAGIIAAHRAFDALRAAHKRICNDTYARDLMPDGFTVIGQSDLPEEVAINLFKDLVPGFHEFFLARSRYIDEYLQHCLDNGLEQLVILGAGYDSRAYRFSGLTNLNVFEVDHLNTQLVKKQKVRAIFHSLPGYVRYVPADIQQEHLQSILIENGYDHRRKTLFILEGLTMYLNATTVDETLLFISRHSGTGSSVIFDYTFDDVLNRKVERREAKAWLAIAEDSNEPLLFGICSEGIEKYLMKRGFHKISSITSDYLNRKYYRGKDEGREATPILAIVHAETIF